MNNLSGSQFSIRLPNDLVIKLELEKEACGINSRAKMIEKCLRFYFEKKEKENDLKSEVYHLTKEVALIKKKFKSLTPARVRDCS